MCSSDAILRSGAILLRKLSGAKIILHVQDYEVDAMVGLGLSKSPLLASLARKFETWCLTSVDKVSTISKSMMRKAVEKKVQPENIIFFQIGLKYQDLQIFSLKMLSI